MRQPGERSAAVEFCRGVQDGLAACRREEIDRMFHLTRVMWKPVSGPDHKRKEQKKSGQLAIF
jgi:hypothetical protein